VCVCARAPRVCLACGLVRAFVRFGARVARARVHYGHTEINIHAYLTQRKYVIFNAPSGIPVARCPVCVDLLPSSLLPAICLPASFAYIVYRPRPLPILNEEKADVGPFTPAVCGKKTKRECPFIPRRKRERTLLSEMTFCGCPFLLGVEKRWGSHGFVIYGSSPSRERENERERGGMAMLIVRPGAATACVLCVCLGACASVWQRISFFLLLGREEIQSIFFKDKAKFCFLLRGSLSRTYCSVCVCEDRLQHHYRKGATRSKGATRWKNWILVPLCISCFLKPNPS
jgi:hypothetical protein